MEPQERKTAVGRVTCGEESEIYQRERVTEQRSAGEKDGRK